jgi:hypothetical protein
MPAAVGGYCLAITTAAGGLFTACAPPAMSLVPFNRLCSLKMRLWQFTCTDVERPRPSESGSRDRNEGESMTVRQVLTACIALLIAVVLGVAVGRASDRDETSLTVQVSSADHELQEGYFSLGDGLTIMAKPGSDLHRFLARQRGRKVKIVLTEATVPALSRLER